MMRTQKIRAACFEVVVIPRPSEVILISNLTPETSANIDSLIFRARYFIITVYSPLNLAGWALIWGAGHIIHLIGR